MNKLEVLTIDKLIKCANEFCNKESKVEKSELFGVTDGKAVGTFVEHSFQNFLSERYDCSVGSSANGLDLPSLNTDIKVTSIKQPQSSCPYKDSKQKIFGLGYNLIVFVYEKIDNHETKKGALNFVSCTYIDKSRTADFQTTSGILNIIRNKGNKDDIFAFLNDKNIPGDEVTLLNMAEYILENPPMVGYLTISNALQWRLQYSRVVYLTEQISGITTIVKYEQTKN
jgi:hypothetical protein